MSNPEYQLSAMNKDELSEVSLTELAVHIIERTVNEGSVNRLMGLFKYLQVSLKLSFD